MPNAGLKTIIALSFILAVGFLLVILSCALWKSYYPLLVVATYVLAPVPNWLCSLCANPDDFVESSSGSAVLDLGRFCTGFLVIMGIGRLTSFGRGCRTVGAVQTDKCLSSPPYRSRTLADYPDRRDGDVRSRRSSDLRHRYQLHHVLPGGAGLLKGLAVGAENGHMESERNGHLYSVSTSLVT